MKNIKLIFTLIILTAIISFNSINTYADNSEIEEEYVLNQEETMLKGEAYFIRLRYLGELIGAKVNWDNNTRIASIIKDEKILNIKLEDRLYTSVLDENMKETYMSSFIGEGSLYVEIDKISEYFEVELVIDEEVLDVSNEYEIHKVPVLLYHHLVDESEMTEEYRNNPSIITKQKFQEDMNILKANGYTAITNRQLYEHLNGINKAPEKSVVITFDDGYLSNYVYAYPILKEKGFVASLFLIVALNEDYSKEWNTDAFTHVSWQQCNKMKDVFEYHCHTYDMHKIDESGLSYLEVKSKEEIKRDLEKSMHILEEYGFNKFRSIAYPYGRYNENTLKVLSELDVEMGITVKSGYADCTNENYEINRFVVYPTTQIENIINLKQ